MKLLVVEDEPQMAHSISDFLSQHGFSCDIAESCFDAEEKINLFDYDCFILDIGMPDGSGLQLLKIIQRRGSTSGVIILSARNSIHDKVIGLELGADDYIPKPFHLSELNARVNALIRRTKFKGEQTLELGNILVEPENQIVKVSGREITLKKKEYELLVFFLINKDRILSKTSLAGHIWGESLGLTASYDFLYAQIKNLRKALQAEGASYNVQTVYGLGYRFMAQ